MGSVAIEDAFCIFSSTENGCYISQWLWAAPFCKQGADGGVKCTFSESGVNFVQNSHKFSKERTCLVDWEGWLDALNSLTSATVNLEEMALVTEYIRVLSLPCTDIICAPCKKIHCLCSGFTYLCLGRSRRGREGVKTVQCIQKSMERFTLTSMDFGFGT